MSEFKAPQNGSPSGLDFLDAAEALSNGTATPEQKQLLDHPELKAAMRRWAPKLRASYLRLLDRPDAFAREDRPMIERLRRAESIACEPLRKREVAKIRDDYFGGSTRGRAPRLSRNTRRRGSRRAATRSSARSGDSGESGEGEGEGEPDGFTFARYHQLTPFLSPHGRSRAFGALPRSLQRAAWTALRKEIDQERFAAC
jgi:hypothetical protein